MKAFNLDDAKSGKQVVTRTGSTPSVYFSPTSTDISVRHVNGVLAVHCQNGAVRCDLNNQPMQGGYDLFMAPEIKKVWVNIAQSNAMLAVECVGTYKTKAEADKWELGCWHRIACVEIAYTEGEGL